MLLEMNEKIIEFLKLSTDIVEIVNPETGITHQREFFNKEMFAELIVQECARKLEDDGMVEVAMEIKDYFGVK